MKDLPDWTRQVVIRYEGGFVGLEELAARLGSIAPWDLKGNIVLMEDFETELTEWSDDSDGLGSTATRVSEHKYSGGYSVKLTIGSGAAWYAMLGHPFHYPGMSKYGAFARFCIDSTCRTIGLEVALGTGTKWYYPWWRYDRLNKTLKVLTTGNVYQNIDTVLIMPGTVYLWHPVLITFNLNTGYYDKLYFGSKEYNIASIPLYSLTSTAAPGGYIAPEALREDSGVFSAYVDDIILVKNVP